MRGTVVSSTTGFKASVPQVPRITPRTVNVLVANQTVPASNSAPLVRALVYTPSAALAQTYDRFVVKRIRVHWSSAIREASSPANGIIVAAYDNGGSTTGTYANVTHLLNLQNCSVMETGGEVPRLCTYTIEHPANRAIIGGVQTLTNNPISTENGWDSGEMMFSTFSVTGTGGAIDIWIEYEIDFIQNRAL